MAHVHRGDMVVVIKGRERGKRGKVKRVTPGGRVEIEKVMMVKRHTRPSQKNPHGGIQDVEGTVPLANVAMWCETCSAPRRTKFVVSDGRKERACVKCEGAFPNPGM
jgi:large subunit ribosomal protein L24